MSPEILQTLFELAKLGAMLMSAAIAWLWISKRYPFDDLDENQPF